MAVSTFDWRLPFCFSLMLFSVVFGLSLVSDPLSTDGGLLKADAKDAEGKEITRFKKYTPDIHHQ